MKRIINLILYFLIGFYGVSFLIDPPEIFLLKSKVFFWGVVIATILDTYDSVKRVKY